MNDIRLTHDISYEMFDTNLGLYSLSSRTTYRQFSRGLEAARLDVLTIVSLCN